MSTDQPGEKESETVGLTPGTAPSRPILSGRWQLGEPIAETDSGLVYKAHDQMADREVVVKIHSLDRSDAAYKQKLHQCFRAATRLMHPNIIAATEIGETDQGNAFFVSPYVPGASLYQELTQKGQLGSERSIAICLQICKAFVHAHSKGVSHKLSIKDVLLVKAERERDFVKIVGFGLSAKNIKETEVSQSTASTDLYQSATIQLNRSPLTADAIFDDVQHIGQVMKSMASGAKKQQSQSASSSKLAESQFKAIVDALSSKKGRNFYKSVSDLQNDLEIILSGSQEDWNKRSLMQSKLLKSQRKYMIAGSGILVIALAIIFGVMWLGASLQGSNRFDSGEEPGILWPPPKNVTPSALGQGVAKNWTKPGDYDAVIQFADDCAAKSDFADEADALKKYCKAAATQLSERQSANLEGRLAAAELQLNRLDEARKAADSSIKGLKITDEDSALAALDVGMTLAQIGLAASLSPEEDSFITGVHDSDKISSDGQRKYPGRFGLFSSRLGDLDRSFKHFPEAEREYLVATQCWQVSPAHHGDLVKALYGLAQAYQAEGKTAPADDAFRKALKEGAREEGRQRLIAMIKSSYADLLWASDKGRAISLKMGL